MNDNILSRSLKIIEILASESLISFDELVLKSGIPRTSVFRILKILEENNYVDKKANNLKDMWFLTYKISALSSLILSKSDFRTKISDILEELAFKSKETAQLGILHEGKILFLDVIQHFHSMLNIAKPGQITDINLCAAGFAIMPYLNEKKQNELLKNRIFKNNTIHTITKIDELKKEYLKVKQRGFSLDNQYYAIGVRCIGAPIFDFNNEVIGALNITGHISHISDDRIDSLAEMVKEYAKIASLRMGYKSLI